MGDPLEPHRHEPNLDPPSPEPALRLVSPQGRSWTVTPADLATLPQTAVANCFIVSTGHGTSGPFTFSGVALADLVAAYYRGPWSALEVWSADGFGNRVREREAKETQRPIILATQVDQRSMSRAEGLVRLIVPSELDDALRQVKWVGQIIIIA